MPTKRPEPPPQGSENWPLRADGTPFDNPPLSPAPPRRKGRSASVPVAKQIDSDMKERQEIRVLLQIREAIGDPHGKLMQDELVEKIRDLRNRTIEECAVKVSTAERGTRYDWVPRSHFESMANTMAEQIRKLKTSK